MEDKYERAIAIWIARKTKQDADKISDIHFGTGSDGYCETCYTEYVTIEYKYGGKFSDLGSISYDRPAQLVQEVSEILAELE